MFEKDLEEDMMKILTVNTLSVYMKSIFMGLLLLFCLGCNNDSKEEQAEAKVKEGLAQNQSDIDLLQGSTPKSFSVKAMDGKVYQSAENKGKFWVIYIYNNADLAAKNSGSTVKEIKQLHEQFGDKIPMLGIVNGFNDDNQALKNLFAAAHLPFEHIDNTEGPNKTAPIKDNVFCTPASILINPEGKVVYNGCGSGFGTLSAELNQLVNDNRL